MKITCLAFLISTTAVFAQGCDEFKIKFLADNCKVLYKTADPKTQYVYDPGVAVCPNGRIIGTFGIGGPGEKNLKPVKGHGRGFVYVSDDDGENWKYITNYPIEHQRPFVAGNKLYILGHHRDLRITKSDDWGNNWTKTVNLTEGQQWHGSATNVWYKDNFVYLVMERRMGGQMKKGWKVSELAPVLMRGDINKDLTKKENWTFASEMSFHKVINDKKLDYFGTPFYDGFYPESKRYIRGGSSFHPAGWLEANVVQITDPKHWWYDKTGNTFHIFMRAHTGLTNIACVIKAVEQSDGSIKTMLQKAPSGKTHLYLPFPGGQMKFSVVYDKKTKLYWMCGTQSTDSMTRPEMLSVDRYCLGDNERRRLVLHFSKNMIDWCFAGVVAIGPSEKSSRHYINMAIKENDLLIMSRSGDLESKDAHNGNIATFHRVKNFRNLVY